MKELNQAIGIEIETFDLAVMGIYIASVIMICTWWVTRIQTPPMQIPKTQPSRGDEGPRKKKRDVKRYDWTPFKRIPDVSDMTISLSKMDDIMLKFNVVKRCNGAKLTYSPYSNKSVNRYFEHQLRRMGSKPDKKF
jgi:hypothetical protein